MLGWLGATAACATGTALLAMAVRGGNWPLLFMLAVFAPITLVMLLVVLLLTGKHCVTATTEGLVVRRSWGPLGNTRRIPHGNVLSVSYKESASEGSQKKWYRIYATTVDGKKRTLAGMVPGQLAARWLVQQVQNTLGTAEPVTMSHAFTE